MNHRSYLSVLLGALSLPVVAQTNLDSRLVECANMSLQLTRQQTEAVTTPAERVTFYDFQLAAFAQLQLKLDNPTTVDTLFVHVGECMKDGRVDRNPGGSRRYRRMMVVTKPGQTEYNVPIPTDRRNVRHPAIRMPKEVGEVTPFRYCEVETSGRLDYHLSKESVIRTVVNAPFDDNAAYFRCDNENLNKVWDLCKHSIKATTYTGYYVDGDRERISYEADALINQLCHYGVDAEYGVARRTFEHLLKYPTWPTEWILQMDMVAWYDYLYTGNTELISKYETELRAHTLMGLRDEETGLITTKKGQSAELLKSISRKEPLNDIVDWPHSGILGLATGQGGEDDGYVYTDFNTVVNAYHYEAVRRLSAMLAAIGKTEDSRQLAEYCQSFRETFNKAFYDQANGRYRDGIGTEHASLHANMFAMTFGLVPEEERERVADFIVSRGMVCSVYGSQFLLDALYDSGRADVALALMSSDAKRSWMNMLREGSTITMEAWGNEFKPNQDWNHAWGAAPANIIPFRLMGVRPIKPAFEEVEIRPQVASLKEAECQIPTIRGGIQMSIHQTDTNYSMSVKLPENVQATVVLPADKLQGKYKIRVNGSKAKAIRQGNDMVLKMKLTRENNIEIIQKK